MRFLLLLATLISDHALAELCGDREIPICPSSGVRVLDATYPASAIVVGTGYDRLTPKIISGIIASCSNMLECPKVMVPNKLTYGGESERRIQFRSLLESAADELAAARSIDRASALQFIEQHTQALPLSPEPIWYQDHLQAIIDPSSNDRTGLMILNGKNESADPQSLSVMKALNARIPNGLRNSPQSTLPPAQAELPQSSSRGGNIEGFPGGYCLVGDNTTSEYRHQFCGPAENVIELDVSWLQVGHIDEVVSVIPISTTDGRPAECNFTVAYASPQKAKELIAQRGSSRLLLPNLTNKSIPSLRNTDESKSQFLYHQLCQASRRSSPSSSQPTGGARRALFRLLNLDAIADTTSCEDYNFLSCPSVTETCRLNPTDQDCTQLRSERCRRMGSQSLTNCISLFSRTFHSETCRNEYHNPNFHCRRPGEYLFGECDKQDLTDVSGTDWQSQWARESESVRAQELIHQAMTANLKLMKDALFARLPQCRPFEASLFVPFPALFEMPPNTLLSAPGIPEARLPRTSRFTEGEVGRARPVFPNPINGLRVNGSFITQSTYVTPFDDYISATLRERGVRPLLLDTYRTTHDKGGGIHCVTNTLSTCRPRSCEPR